MADSLRGQAAVRPVFPTRITWKVSSGLIAGLGLFEDIDVERPMPTGCHSALGGEFNCVRSGSFTSFMSVATSRPRTSYTLTLVI